MTETDFLIIILVTVLVFVGLVVILIIFFNYSQKKIIEEKELNHQQKMGFQKEMLESTIKTQEEERTRIARELHDDISSKLNVVNMNLNFLKMKMSDEENLKIAEEVSQVLNQSLDRSRKIAHELMPPILVKFGLKEAILELAQQINSSERISVDLSNEDILETITGDEKLHIFRIAQELSNNTLKHAEADHIQIAFSKEEDAVEIIYQDDGKGLRSDKVTKGIGMMNIESRIQMLNGSWEIIPSEKGAVFKLIIPHAAQINTSR